MNMSSKTLVVVALACAIAAVAVTARTYRLFDSSIWVDDAWSMAAATGHSLDVRLPGMQPGETYADPKGIVPARFFLQYIQPRPGNNAWRVANDSDAQESHPPWFYVLLYLWMYLFGYTVAAARALSLTFGLLTLILLFILGRRMIGETGAWIACFFCAIAPFQSQIAVQIRSYTYFGFLVVSSCWITYDILERGATPRRVSLMIWRGIIGMLTHYYYVLYCFIQGLGLLTQRRLRTAALQAGAIWGSVVVVLAGYYFTQPSRAAQPWMNTPWDASLLLINASSAVTDLLVFNPAMCLSLWIPPSSIWLIVIKLGLIAVVAATLLVAARRVPQRQLVMLLVWLAGPILMMFVLDLIRHSGTVMNPRYMVGSSFALYLLLGAGLSRVNVWVRAAGVAFIALMMLAGQVALRQFPVGTLAEGADFKQIGDEISRGWRAGDVVVIHSSYGSAPVSLAYYLPPETPMLALIYLPRKDPGPVIQPSTSDDLQPRLERYISGKQHIWVVRAFLDGPWDELDRWVSANYRMVRGKQYGAATLREIVLK